VHDVVFDAIGFHGSEGAEADVQSDVMHVNIFGANFLEEIFGEVKSGGGRGD
jgi:hypothetical protein